MFLNPFIFDTRAQCTKILYRQISKYDLVESQEKLWSRESVVANIPANQEEQINFNRLMFSCFRYSFCYFERIFGKGCLCKCTKSENTNKQSVCID